MRTSHRKWAAAIALGALGGLTACERSGPEAKRVWVAPTAQGDVVPSEPPSVSDHQRAPPASAVGGSGPSEGLGPETSPPPIDVPPGRGNAAPDAGTQH